MTPSSAPGTPFHRVLLVGFMGAGKSAVGRGLATELGWLFRDFDTAASERLGLPIHAIFEEYGEGAFRAVEERIALEHLGLERAVLASGGGWPCTAGRLEGLDDRTLSIWLRVTPEDAVARCRADRVVRPLLDAPDPVERARDLLEERIPYYELARWHVDTSLEEPEALAARLADRIRSDAGRSFRE